MRKAIMAVATVATLATGACSALGRQAFKSPDVKIQDVRVTGVGLTGGQLDVVVNVANPNGYRLDATKLDYTVQIDTVTFANGTINSAFSVDANQTTTFHIPVSFTYAGVGAAGRSLLNTGGAPYHVFGNITVGTVVGSFPVNFSKTGTVTVFGGAR